MSGEIYSHGGVLEFHFSNAPTHTPREANSETGTAHNFRAKQASGLLFFQKLASGLHSAAE